jgi:hypothetical protein
MEANDAPSGRHLVPLSGHWLSGRESGRFQHSSEGLLMEECSVKLLERIVRMRKTIITSVIIGLLIFATIAVVQLNSAYKKSDRKVRALTAERDLLAAKLDLAERVVAELKAESAKATNDVAAAGVADEPALVEADAVVFRPPQVTVEPNGKKSYFFPELQGADGQVIARDAQFRELLGYTKLSFRTSQGIRYYDLKDVHPEVIRSLGYDAAILKRRLEEETRYRLALGTQAQLQQDLRNKAAIELAEREKAAAERIKAEAALREAQARERLAEAAERNATNPPKPQRITQKVIIGVPYDPDRPNPPGTP